MLGEIRCHLSPTWVDIRRKSHWSVAFRGPPRANRPDRTNSIVTSPNSFDALYRYYYIGSERRLKLAFSTLDFRGTQEMILMHPGSHDRKTDVCPGQEQNAV